jgi:hypothetical protein
MRLCRGRHNRKNYLFAGSDASGRRAAILYTLIRTATLNGRDPEAYLRDVLAWHCGDAQRTAAAA